MNVKKFVIKFLFVDIFPVVVTKVFNLIESWEYMLTFLILSLIIVCLWEYTETGKNIDEKIAELNPFSYISLVQAVKILRNKTNVRDQDDFFAPLFEDAPGDYRIKISLEILFELIKDRNLKLYGNEWPSNRKKIVPLSAINSGFFDEKYENLFKDIAMKTIDYTNLRVNKYKLVRFIENQKKLPLGERSINFYRK